MKSEELKLGMQIRYGLGIFTYQGICLSDKRYAYVKHNKTGGIKKILIKKIRELDAK